MFIALAKDLTLVGSRELRRFVDDERPWRRQHRPRDRRLPCRQASDIADAQLMKPAAHIRASFDKVSRLASDDNPVIALPRIRMRLQESNLS